MVDFEFKIVTRNRLLSDIDGFIFGSIDRFGSHRNELTENKQFHEIFKIWKELDGK